MPALPRWKAYGDLVNLAKEHHDCKLESLATLLTADAKDRGFPRSKYKLRTLYHMQAVPKDPSRPRQLRWYRQEHLYLYFQSLVKERKVKKAYAKHLEAIAPPSAETGHLQNKGPRDQQIDNLITVDLSAFSLKLKPLKFDYGKIMNFGDLTDQVYLALGNKYLKPYRYGRAWVLVFAKSGRLIENMRMKKKLVGYERPVPDLRPLEAVGIQRGTKLRAIRIVCTAKNL